MNWAQVVAWVRCCWSDVYLNSCSMRFNLDSLNDQFASFGQYRRSYTLTARKSRACECATYKSTERVNCSFPKQIKRQFGQSGGISICQDISLQCYSPNKVVVGPDLPSWVRQVSSQHPWVLSPFCCYRCWREGVFLLGSLRWTLIPLNKERISLFQRRLLTRLHSTDWFITCPCASSLICLFMLVRSKVARCESPRVRHRGVYSESRVIKCPVISFILSLAVHIQCTGQVRSFQQLPQWVQANALGCLLY